jgi:hypothetical protein
MTEKIKSLAKTNTGKDVLSVVIIAIISLGSFQLGRNSTMNTKASQVQISGAREVLGQNITNKYADINTTSQEYSSKNLTTNSEASTSGDIYTKGNYLASSRGKKYYPVDCPAAQNIKESNKVYFKTAGEAESKGYTLSSSCN